MIETTHPAIVIYDTQRVETKGELIQFVYEGWDSFGQRATGLNGMRVVSDMV